MGEVTDRRTTRTKKSLKNAMLTLLQKKSINRITVSELSKLADIGRGTFYLHYADPYDLLDKIEDEMLEQLTAINSYTEGGQRYNYLLEHLEQVWQYMYANQALLKILIHSQDGARFLKKLSVRCEDVAFSFSDEKNMTAEDRYVVTYIISGSLGVFQKWMEEGAVHPPEQLAKILRKMIEGI